MMDIPKILQYKYAGQEWSLIGENYDGLTWLSDTPKPSEEELQAQWSEVQQMMKQKVEDEIAAKMEILNKLGITPDEAKILFS